VRPCPGSAPRRLEHAVPAVGAVHVAGTQGAAFEITELVEHEQRMIAGAGVMPVPDAHLLLAMGWAHARIHVEHNAPWRAAAVHKVDPLARQGGKSREVRRCREPLSFEAAHLARRCCTALRRFAADNPAHGRIVAQAFGVVYVLISNETTKHRLPQQTDQRVAAVLAGACIGERLARHRGQPEGVVEFTICQQSRVGRDH
jgi:hypothetical protein